MESDVLRNKKPRKYYFVSLILFIFIITSGSIIYFVFRQPSGTLPYPISKSIARKLGFDIYYPDQKLLPIGYHLDISSFVVNNQALIYSVDYGNGNKIVFSDQIKPNALQIQDFYTKDMPLNSSFYTSNGLATIGAINARTVVSLPTNTNAWLIITAPGNTNQDNIKQVVTSVRIAR